MPLMPSFSQMLTWTGAPPKLVYGLVARSGVVAGRFWAGTGGLCRGDSRLLDKI